MDDLEKAEDDSPSFSNRSVDPQIQLDPPMEGNPQPNSSRLSTSRSTSSATTRNDVISYLDKVEVDTRLGDIDQVCLRFTWNNCLVLPGLVDVIIGPNACWIRAYSLLDT